MFQWQSLRTTQLISCSQWQSLSKSNNCSHVPTAVFVNNNCYHVPMAAFVKNTADLNHVSMAIFVAQKNKCSHVPTAVFVNNNCYHVQMAVFLCKSNCSHVPMAVSELSVLRTAGRRQKAGNPGTWTPFAKMCLGNKDVMCLGNKNVLMFQRRSL